MVQFSTIADQHKTASRLQQADDLGLRLHMRMIPDPLTVNHRLKTMPIGIAGVIWFADEQDGHLGVNRQTSQFQGMLDVVNRSRVNQVIARRAAWAARRKSSANPNGTSEIRSEGTW